MADTVTFQSATPATPPSATVVATDDAGASGHVQIVKLAQSADGSASPIAADANGLDVDVTRLPALPAGTNNIGDVDVLTLPALPAGNNNIGDVDVASLPALPAGNNNIGDVDVASLPAIPAGGNKIGAVDLDSDAAPGAAVPATAQYVAGTDGTNARGLKTDANGELQVDVLTLPTVTETNSNAIKTAVELIDDTIFTDDAGFTPGTSKVQAIGAQADETSTDSVDEGDIGAPRMTLDRKLLVNPQPHTKGGLAVFRSLDLDETEEDVKTSPGQIYGWWITNRATSPRYIKIYNATAANVTVGTTTPLITLEVPGNSTDHIAANALGAMGIEFDTAISAAATTGLADNDTGAPGANDVLINIFYK